MGGTATWSQTNFTGQDPTTYRSALDANAMVAAAIVDAFAAHAAATANMTILVDAGIVSVAGSNPVSVAQQTSAAMNVPVTNPRNDLAVVDTSTGALSIVTGTEAPTPADPAVPSGKIAVARIRHSVGESAIQNSQIDDLRSGSAIPASLPQTPAGNSSGDLLVAGADYAADSSTTVNTVTATLTPAPTAYYTGLKCKIKIANTNTAAATVNLNGLGAKAIANGGTNALIGGELPQGWIADLLYDGTNFQLLNSAGPQAGALVADAGAAGALVIGSGSTTQKYIGGNGGAFGANASLALNVPTGQGFELAIEGADILQAAAGILKFAETAGGTPGNVWRDGLAAASLAANGYQKFPSGLILQWGSATSGSGGGASVTFPTAFPNAALAAFACSATNQAVTICAAVGLSATAMTLGAWNVTGSGASNCPMFWLAVGY